MTRIKHKGSSVDRERQTSPHPHQVVLDPSGHYALIPDLGLDQIVAYRFDSETGQLTPNDSPFIRTAPGAGPRHLAFHPDGHRAFGINELDLTVAVYNYDERRGVLSLRETEFAAAAPAGSVKSVDRTGVSGAEIAVHPSGNFVYVSLRGADEIVVYQFDEPADKLTFLERIPTGGKTPRNFAIDPSGKWLLTANQNSASITVFRIGDDGRLIATAQHASVPAPACLEFLKR